MPATAHGLQGRFNARTVTKRKYPGSAPVPVEPALPHLWHGPVRSLSFTKTVFSEIRGHGGSVTQRVPLRIRVSFYSIFNLHEACLNLRAIVTRSVLPLISHFIFRPKSVRLTKNFSKFFLSAADLARLRHEPLFHGRPLPGQCPVWSCRE